MESCCHVGAGAPSCYLELLDKPQRRICRIVGPSLAASLEPLAHHQNIASLSLFCRYYFDRCSYELATIVPFPYSRGRSSRYSDRFHAPFDRRFFLNRFDVCFNLFVLLFLVAPCPVVAVQPCME